MPTKLSAFQVSAISEGLLFEIETCAARSNFYPDFVFFSSESARNPPTPISNDCGSKKKHIHTVFVSEEWPAFSFAQNFSKVVGEADTF